MDARASGLRVYGAIARVGQIWRGWRERASKPPPGPEDEYGWPWRAVGMVMNFWLARRVSGESR